MEPTRRRLMTLRGSFAIVMRLNAALSLFEK
jgi:hypothetical protein